MNDKQQIFDKYGNYNFPTEKKQDSINTATTQIEEMTKMVRSVLESRTDITFIPDLDKPIAEELLKKYQPKLPEDSVVLTREEWEKELWKMHDKGFELSKLFIEKEKQKVRKETARELFQAIEKSKYVEKFNGLSGAVKMISLDDIKKILKDKFGVEIKE